MGTPRWDGTADDLIDTRDLIEYAEYWTPVTDEDDNLTDEEKEILEAIERLEGEGISDWEHGATLIKDSYFKEYAQELAEDIGAIGTANPKSGVWPLYCIDWDWAVRELQHDYSCVEFLGEDYWVRN